MAIRSTQNLFMLEKALAETDPETTDVAVMTAKLVTAAATCRHAAATSTITTAELMTAVVERAEKTGKHVQPLILPTNNPLFAIVQHRQGTPGPGACPRGLEHPHRRRADGADRLLLDQHPRRASRRR